jgi:hypothetical protein
VTLSQLRAHTRRKLAEQTASTSFWSDTDLDDFINRAYEQVISEAELLQCDSTATSVAGQQQYSVPSDALRILRIYFQGRDGPLEPKTLSEMDLGDPAWPTKVCAAGEVPTTYVVRSNLFHLVPAPAEAGKTITVWAIQAPADLAADGDTPLIAKGYHEAIAVGAAIRALKADRTNPDNATSIKTLEADYRGAMVLAASQGARKAPINRLRDIRDYYTTASGWRS